MTEDKHIFVIKRSLHCTLHTSTFYNDWISPGDQFVKMKWDFFNGKAPAYNVKEVEAATHLQFEGEETLYPIQHYFRWKGINFALQDIKPFEQRFHEKRKQERKRQTKAKYYRHA